MATVKGWEQLTEALQKKVNATLEDNVFKAVKEVYLEHIESDVYDKYTPKIYERRHQSGGLADEHNITGKMVEGTLEVMNIGMPNDSLFGKEFNSSYLTQFASWIENGDAGKVFGGDFSGEPWANPRPFTENTIKDLKQNKQHIKAFKEGLKSRGIKTL